jgi:hypothetical protein
MDRSTQKIIFFMMLPKGIEYIKSYESLKQLFL